MNLEVEFYNEGASQPTHDMQHPHGRYVECEDRTFLVLQGKCLDPYAFSYGHETGTWNGPVKVGTNPLNEDSHGPGVLEIGPDGCLHVFFGSHNSEVQYRRSKDPYDISSWEEPASNFTGSHTYSMPVVVGDDIYHFYRWTKSRDNRPLAYVKSSDGGDTWSEKKVVVEPEDLESYRTYASRVIADDRNNIHFSWFYMNQNDSFNNGNARYNVHHAYLDLNTKIVKDMNGTAYGSKISSVNDTKIIDTWGENQVNGTRCVLIDGTPYINYNRQVDTESGCNFEHRMVYWTGECWSEERTIAETNDNFDT